MFAPVIGLSIIGRAVERQILTVRMHNPLDALVGSERADDTPYGGGAGMLLRLEPLTRVLDGIIAQSPLHEKRAMILLSPSGQRFEQALARRFSQVDRLVLICGHYEGVDDRLMQLYPCEEMSVGDWIVTGGEIPAMMILDATARLCEGTIRAESLHHESFENAQLDYPSYTRPARFRGVDVPAVLLSGDHTAIAAWRREQSRERTRQRRPDLLQ